MWMWIFLYWYVGGVLLCLPVGISSELPSHILGTDSGWLVFVIIQQNSVNLAHMGLTGAVLWYIMDSWVVPVLTLVLAGKFLLLLLYLGQFWLLHCLLLGRVLHAFTWCHKQLKMLLLFLYIIVEGTLLYEVVTSLQCLPFSSLLII